MNNDPRQRGNAFEDFHCFGFDRAHSAHPGIDFEINRRFADSIKRLCFFEGGNRWDESALNNGWYFFRQRRPENYDREMKSFKGREPFLQIGDAEKLHVVAERLSNAHESVAVSVRLHHREHFRRADPLAHDLGVVTQRTSIDLSPAAIILRHLFGIVMWGSRKYIGSSGGCANSRFESANFANSFAEG